MAFQLLHIPFVAQAGDAVPLAVRTTAKTLFLAAAAWVC